MLQSSSTPQTAVAAVVTVPRWRGHCSIAQDVLVTAVYRQSEGGAIVSPSNPKHRDTDHPTADTVIRMENSYIAIVQGASTNSVFTYPILISFASHACTDQSETCTQTIGSSVYLVTRE